MDLKEYSTAETVDVKSIPAEVYDIIAQILIREYTEQFYEEDEQVAVWYKERLNYEWICIFVNDVVTNEPGRLGNAVKRAVKKRPKKRF